MIVPKKARKNPVLTLDAGDFSMGSLFHTLARDEAFELRAMSANKGFSAGKKIFLICVNSFSLDAQNVMLKMFEEPTENTLFFLVVPDVNYLLKTFLPLLYFPLPPP